MALKFSCSSCGATIISKFLSVGEQAICRSCGALTNVPPDAQTATGADEEFWLKANSPTGAATPPISSATQESHDSYYQDEAPQFDEQIIGNPNNRSATDYLQLGYDSCKGNFGVAIGGFLLNAIIVMFGQMIPIIGYLFVIFLTPAFHGGLTRLQLNIARRTNPRIENLFDGFSRYGTLIGINFLIMLGAMVLIGPVALLVVFSAFGSNVFSDPDPFKIFLFVIGYGLIFIALMLIGVLVVFVYPIAMDTHKTGIVDCFKLSYRIAMRHYWKIVVYYILGFIMVLISLLLLIIPALFTMQIFAVGLMRLYLDLRADYERSMAPAPQPTQPPPQSTPQPPTPTDTQQP